MYMEKPWEEYTEEEKAEKWQEWERILEETDEDDWISLEEYEEKHGYR
jgi:hypothetical protein